TSSHADLEVLCSSRRRHTRSKRDWSSDVCSSDLRLPTASSRTRSRFHSEASTHRADADRPERGRATEGGLPYPHSTGADAEPPRARAPNSQFISQSIDATDRKSTRLNSSHVSISYAVF